MERSYTILLDKGGQYPARLYRNNLAFEQPLELVSRQIADPPRPAVHRERLSAQELQELAQEPDFVAAAEIMQTRLLSPVAELRESEPPGIGRPRRTPWGIPAVGADHSKFNGSGVNVAVLDTGIDANHPAFRDMQLVEKDFTGLGNGDFDGHGTHCAGIVFGRNVEGVRIGVAPGVRSAWIAKVLGPQGGDSDMLARGLLWAHEQGAHVISLSVGFDFSATIARRIEEGWPDLLATQAALEAYRANLKLFNRMLRMFRMQEPFTGGALVVAAAGNDSSRKLGAEYVMSACPPCGSDGVVAVGSLDPDAHGQGYRVSDFSNSGVQISAPGSSVVSAAAGGGLRSLSGTSVAAPHVAGVAALWWQAVRQSGLPANATLVRGKLLGSARLKGFSPSVYPADRGAGCVVAPRDGVAVASQRPADRFLPDLAPPPEDSSWSKDRVLGVGFEPIAIELGMADPPSHGGRRTLC